MELCDLVVLSLVGAILCWHGGHALESPIEYRLITTLLSEYDVNARPVIDPEDTVRVEMRISLIQILNLDERSQVLTASFWMSWHWKDVSLQWYPQEYGNITRIRIPTKRLWRPDISLSNDVSTEKQNIEDYHAIVSSDGSVDWYFPYIYHSSCTLDITYFPWDKQECTLAFSSWTYDVTKLDIFNRTAEGNLGYFMGDGVWVVKDFPVVRIVETYVETISSLIYTLKLERKPLYYIYNLVLPCVCITFCGLLVFLLPPDCGEKISMAVTMLLSATVFLVVFSESMPVQSDVIPVIGIFFMACIFMLVLSTVLSVMVLCIHHRGALDIRLPPAARKLVLECLATMVCMQATVRAVLAEADDTKDCSEDEETAKEPGENGTKNGGKKKGKGKRSPEDRDTHEQEWVLAAMVLDRFFFIFFVVAIILCSLVILLYRP